MKFPIAPESMKALRGMEKGEESGCSSCMQTGTKIRPVGEDAEWGETITLHSRSISIKVSFTACIRAVEAEALNCF